MIKAAYDLWKIKGQGPSGIWTFTKNTNSKKSDILMNLVCYKCMLMIPVVDQWFTAISLRPLTLLLVRCGVTRLRSAVITSSQSHLGFLLLVPTERVRCWKNETLDAF